MQPKKSHHSWFNQIEVSASLLHWYHGHGVLSRIEHYGALDWTLKQKFRWFDNLWMPSSVKPFADEGSCRLPKRLNLCYSVLASATDLWIWAYLVLSPEQSALLVGSWDAITLLALNRSNRPQLQLVGSHFDRQRQTGTYTKSRIAILKRDKMDQ